MTKPEMLYGNRVAHLLVALMMGTRDMSLTITQTTTGFDIRIKSDVPAGTQENVNQLADMFLHSLSEYFNVLGGNTHQCDNNNTATMN